MAPEQIDQLQVLERLAVALAIGLLIGLERGWELRDLHTTQRTAGIRTFAAFGLLGGITAQFGGVHGSLLIAAFAIALAVILAVGYWRESEADRDVSLTTSVTALVSYAMGALAGRGELLAASSSAVVLTMLLGFRPELHNLIRKIERSELQATFRLLLISVVMLPVLPNRSYGPWDAFNPYHVWWMVVLVAGISYVGYFATRWWGAERGILVTGLFGGLASSTVVALSLARRAAGDLAEPKLLAAGATIASAMMWPRIMLIVCAVDPVLGWSLAWPFGSAAATGMVCALVLARPGRQDRRAGAVGEKVKTSNPLEIGFAIRFALLLTAIMIAARAASAWSGPSGLLVVAGISGLVDAAPISLSVATMTTHQMVTPAVAVAAILIGAAANTALKSTVALAIGGASMGLRFLAASVAMIAASGAGWLIATRLA